MHKINQQIAALRVTVDVGLATGAPPAKPTTTEEAREQVRFSYVG